MNLDICKKCPNHLYFIARQFTEKTLFVKENKLLMEYNFLPTEYYVMCKCTHPLPFKPMELANEEYSVYSYYKKENKWGHTYLHQKEFFKWFRSFRINRKIKELPPPVDCPYWVEQFVNDINKKEYANGN